MPMISTSVDKRILVISDIHLGHKNTSSEFIVKNLYHELNKYKGIEDLDVIFIAGDIFDRLLTLPSDDISHITIWAFSLLKLCSRHKIKLRILEGTPSHDWTQSELFVTLVKANEIDIDFEYVSVLSIEKIKDLNLTVLYIPDEWTSSTDTTLKQVKNLMQAEGLEKVDIAIMHGMFDYQVPQNKNEDVKHSSTEYLSLVNYYIFIGHVHKFSFYDRIIAQGSFDRLTHGEEEEKGFVVATLSPAGNRYDFVINKNAKVYKTLEIKTDNREKELNKLRKALDKLPRESAVRFKIRSDNPLVNVLEEFKKEYIFLTFSRLFTDKDEVVQKTLNDITVESYTITSITMENIESLVKDRLDGRYEQPDVISTLTLLREYINV